MSSFHTTTDSTSGSCDPYQTAETTGNEQATAAVTSNWDTEGPIMSQNLDWIFADVLADWPDAGFGLGNPEPTNVDASSPRFNNSFGVLNNYNPKNTDDLAPWLAPTPHLTDSQTITSPSSVGLWSGHFSLPIQPATGRQGDPLPCGSGAAIPLPYSDLAWQFESGQFASPTTPWADGNGCVMEPSLGLSSTISWGSAEIGTYHLGVEDIDACQATSSSTITPAPRTMLGKRPRVAEETSGGTHAVNDCYGFGPRKRVKGKMASNEVLELAASSSRARHGSSTKTPILTDNKFEAAGRGVGRLAALNAQEVYYQSLPGPSVRNEVAGTTVQGQLPWVEERGGEATWHFTSSGVQQQECSGSARDDEKADFSIPRSLSVRHRSLLDATPNDLARESVHELKCRLCPRAGFSDWDGFKRHCEHCEAHPREIWFCQHCGDFFARKDSLKRHQEKRPAECYKVTPAGAEAKRLVVKKVHDVFEEQLEEHLQTNEGAWTPFSQLIKELFPDSSTSKRGSRQQCRIKGPRT